MSSNSASPASVHFTAGSQPFTTQDAALAFSLCLAGVPFADPSRPCFNLYDAEILSKLGFRGLTLEQAALAAHEAGKKGEVRYIFARTPELNDLLEAYKVEQTAIAQGEGTAAERVAELIPDNAELRLRIAEVILKLRPLFVNMWKNQVPLVRVPNPGAATEQTIGKDKYVTSPGFRVVSLNASEQTKRKLKL